MTTPKTIAGRHLLPADFAAKLIAEPRASVVDRREHLFLVTLPDIKGELAQGLAESSTAGGTLAPATRDTLGYATTAHRIKDLVATRQPVGALATPADLRKVLATGSYFIAPLRKRPIHGKPFADRISIGRARNNDIVLRQADVSKFHAWLECDESGGYFLGDARSKNTTTCNGHTVGREPQLLRACDELMFGSVRVVYTDAVLLWDALHGG